MSGILSIPSETYRVAWGDLCYMKENIFETVVTGIVGPLLYLLAFGFGLGGSMEGGSENYIQFILPGIIALSTLSCTFSTVSMKILVQRLFYMSFDELLLCPVHISSVILGKTLAGVLRATLSCSIIMIVGKIISPDVTISLWVFPVIIAASFTFALFGMLAGILTNKTQKLNLISSLLIVPMTFLCGTLFDVSALPSAAAAVIYFLPLTHVSNLMRGIMLETGVPLDSIVILLAYMVGFFAFCYYLIKNSKC